MLKRAPDNLHMYLKCWQVQIHSKCVNAHYIFTCVGLAFPFLGALKNTPKEIHSYGQKKMEIE